MVDVVFLLLFFFLVVSRFQPPEGMLPAQLPAKNAGISTSIPRTPIRIRFLYDSAKPDQCRVTIDRLNESPIPLEALTDELIKIRDQVPVFDRNTPVHLLADDRIGWEHVVNAYNAALAAEYEKIFFAGS